MLTWNSILDMAYWIAVATVLVIFFVRILPDIIALVIVWLMPEDESERSSDHKDPEG
jgi:phage shock protein PspC (stress-responsive transcriptional regulator)